ncbi:MAG TPA: hypothetical protein VEQ58_14020 [Polyangiaceae bacterium]|nr:hypothetical protein [Polyangiaceae bacterium]
MLSRPRAWFVQAVALLPLCLGCKNTEQDRPLPTPEPPAVATSVAPRTEAAPAPKKRPSAEEPTEKSAPPATTTSGTRGAPAVSASAPAPVASAPTPVASAPAPAAPVPTFTAPSAACLSRCQGALQGCLAAPVDGGVPGFANLDICKKAFEACQAACAKP